MNHLKLRREANDEFRDITHPENERAITHIVMSILTIISML